MARASDSVRSAPVLLADSWQDYALLDSGGGEKLERFGPHVFIRPDSQAWWPKRLDASQWKADAIFAGRESEEMGRWQFIRRVPDAWPMQWNGIAFQARCTPFRHLGVFPEQAVHWSWAQDLIRAARRPVRVLNLFGYTGLATLACAAAGAEVTHLDASRKAVGYGRENQALADLGDAPIRWIVDDAMKFVEREARRGSVYDGIILDPPKHGRGPNGETWKLEEGLETLLAGCASILSPQPLFMVATVYAVRLSFIALDNALSAALSGKGGRIEAGEMAIPEADGARLLPTAIYARWQSDGASAAVRPAPPAAPRPGPGPSGPPRRSRPRAG